MSDDFQRDALAPLMCPRHDCESTRVENKHLRAEIERLQRERDALAAKVASYERADRDLNEALIGVSDEFSQEGPYPDRRCTGF